MTAKEKEYKLFKLFMATKKANESNIVFKVPAAKWAKQVGLPVTKVKRLVALMNEGNW
jgi:hypothetical protein